MGLMLNVCKKSIINTPLCLMHRQDSYMFTHTLHTNVPEYIRERTLSGPEVRTHLKLKRVRVYFSFDY